VHRVDKKLGIILRQDNGQVRAAESSC
jgi:hypothetical protein